MSKKYVEGDLVVFWNAERCIHSGKCVQGLPRVFDPNRRPWIDLTQADQLDIREQVKRCPSGALSLEESKSASQSDKSEWVRVEVIRNGPLAIKSSCTVVMSDGSIKEKEKASFFCRCGGSENKPFCDGSHKRRNFKDE